jgi:hypothetical protein
LRLDRQRDGQESEEEQAASEAHADHDGTLSRGQFAMTPPIVPKVEICIAGRFGTRSIEQMTPPVLAG